MQQRIITVSKRMTVMGQYDFTLDNITSKLNADGWFVKQIVSTSFTHNLSGMSYPVVSVTLLIEKE